MAAKIGIVKSLVGSAKAISQTGEERVLLIGDAIYEGEIIQTTSGSSIDINFDSGKELSMGGEESAVMDSTVYNVEQGDPDVEALQQALLQGEDINPEATAAGDGTNADGGFAEPFFAGRTGDRGDVSTYNLGTSIFGGNISYDPAAELINTAPIANADFGTALEEGSDGDAGMAATGSLLNNDTDDGILGDLDITGLSSESGNGFVTNSDGTISIVGLYGVLVVNADTGEYTYTLFGDDNYSEGGGFDIDQLNVGDSVSETFGYTVSDGELSSTGSLTITIDGQNDVPIAENDFADVQEDGGFIFARGHNGEGGQGEGEEGEGEGGRGRGYGGGEDTEFYAFVTGNVIDGNDAGEGEDTDVDNENLTVDLDSVEVIGKQGGHGQGEGEYEESEHGKDPVTKDGTEYDIVVKGEYGWLFINEDGSYTYELRNGKDKVQSLAEGQIVYDRFEYTVTDNEETGEKTDSAVLQITIHGTNDEPYIYTTDNGSVTEDFQPVGTDDGLVLTDTGTLYFYDVDKIDNHTAEVVNSFTNDNTAVLGSLEAAVNETPDADAYGNIEWTYTVDNAAVQYLGVGEAKVEYFTIELSDGHGGTDTKTISVTITGTNDAPVLAVEDVTGSVMEDYDVNRGSLDDTGQIFFTDVDINDSHTARVVSSSVEGSESSPLGSFDVEIKTDALTGESYVEWDYSVKNFKVQYLAEGETRVENFTIEVSDGHGGVDTETVSVTITGTNDVPNIYTYSFGGVLEDYHPMSTDDGLVLRDSGTLQFYDVDLIDNHEAEVASSFTKDGTEVLGSLEVVVNETPDSGLLGNIGWTYTVDNAAVQYLGVGEAKVEYFTIELSDGHGGTDTRTISVTIFGRNDAPFLAVEDVTGSVVEDALVVDGFIEESGQIYFTDVDVNDTHTVRVVSSDVVDSDDSVFGSLNVEIKTDSITGQDYVEWTYSVDNEKLQYLAEDETRVETFTIRISDGHGGYDTETITVTLTGTNDAPVAVADVGTLEFTGGELTTVDTLENAGGQSPESENRILAQSFTAEDGALETLDFEIKHQGDHDNLEFKVYIIEGTPTGTDFSNALYSTTVDMPAGSGDINVLLNTSLTGLTPGATYTVVWVPVEGEFHLAEGNNLDSDDSRYVYNYNNGRWSSHGVKDIGLVFGFAEVGVNGEILDAQYFAEGNVLANDTDIDNIDYAEDNVNYDLFVSQVDGVALSAAGIEGDYGTLYMDSDGSYRYEVDTSSEAFAALGDGETADEVFQYTVSDGMDTDTADLIISVTGDSGAVNAIVGTDGNDYIDGGDGADVIHAGEGDDMIVYDHLDTLVDGGEGEDTLLYHGNNINFDNIENIEIVDMDNDTTDTINLTAEDVFNATDGDNILTILGDGVDSVAVDGSLTIDPVASSATEGFNVYTGIYDGHEVIVHIDDDINVDYQ